MSKVEQRPVIGIVPTQVPDEDIVRVYGPRWAVSSRPFPWKRQRRAPERSAFARMACISRGKMLAGDGRAFILPIAFNVLLALAFKRLPSWKDVFLFEGKKMANHIDKTYKHSRINAIT